MKKNVVVSGKFRLIHNAHKELIIRACSLDGLEHLHILICEDESYRRHSTVQEVKSAMMEILKGFDIKYSINIVESLENHEGDPKWDKLVIDTVSENLGFNVNPNDIIVTNSKENYKNVLIDNIYINCDLGHNISASKIEENPYDFSQYQYIAKEFMPYINKKVVISGVESSGKTVLATKIAKLFDTVVSNEYGRYYASELLQGNDDAFLPKDFVFIATNQMLQDKKTNLSASRLLVVDTDPIVTLRFLRSYKQHYIENGVNVIHWEEEYSHAEKLLTEICKSYKSDLTLVLKPNCEYVQDGTRWTQEQAEREKHFEELLNIYDEFDKEYIVIESESWINKLDEIKININQLLKLQKKTKGEL